ncbi:L domain-like protein [Rhizoclosmatium globosum]|uniref:L domain-like protein n=1 Tax=Rhizoclosmatium globosum TaxID=329046 RepID=A0A1Y2BTV4_9FUNG|nr:L domain-like protein [Rhizoclosmatium globosum]|eukprot:ORY38200.1 L domain-like protein [Rhizoclosmatium globosum]
MDSAQLQLLQEIQSQLSDIQSRISAIERNQAVLKSSTESHFTTLSATATAHQNTLKSLEYTIADIHHESRETSARLNLLVNGSRKHYTRITQLPDELIAQIFAWINPKTVLKYKRISKSFRATLSTKHFAIANLKTFRYQLSSCWQTWLVWPKEYQDEFVERTCRFKTCISLLRMPWYEKPYRYGSFPERICTLQNLTELIFERQRLTGCIPPAICELKQLHTLVLSRNRFQGPIPEQLGTIPALKILDLCYNLLNGVIPVTWECEFLERLILSHNFLTGEIPSSICNLKHLEILKVNSIS